MALKGSQHISQKQIDWIVDWIINHVDVPSYREVCIALEQRFGLRREPDNLRRRREFKKAMDAKKRASKTQAISQPEKPTQRKFKHLMQENDRLRVQVEQLTEQRDALLERQLEYINHLRALNVHEDNIGRRLEVINRDPTELPSRKAK